MERGSTGKLASVGGEMLDLIRRLYPICRSITGDGLRETLDIIGREIPLEITEVPTGTRVFDWTVPREWNIRDAYIKDAEGNRLVDFRQSNLHVVQYSVPVRSSMTFDELRPHLHVLSDHPEWIPYKTSYYSETWGFCLSASTFANIESRVQPDEELEVVIESTLDAGSLTYGESVIRGQRTEEVLISTHSCHPSLCNDNLSGIALSVQLCRHLMQEPRRYTYRFLFAPGTIGAITWLARNEDVAERIAHGMVVACVGDRGGFHYKRSRQGDAEIDRAAELVLSRISGDPTFLDFSPYGYDERQFCSPGFDLPVGSLTRSPYGTFPEYHSSADNLDFIDESALEESLEVYKRVIDVVEGNGTYVNTNPKCEPQLGSRGLYDSAGGHRSIHEYRMALLWVLNLSDGNHSLLDIAERSGLSFEGIRDAADRLKAAGLLSPLRDSQIPGNS